MYFLEMEEKVLHIFTEKNILQKEDQMVEMVEEEATLYLLQTNHFGLFIILNTKDISKLAMVVMEVEVEAQEQTEKMSM